MGADYKALRADAEQLALHCIVMKARVELFGEDFIQRSLEDRARCFAIDRHVLEAIGNPDVGHARRAERLAELRPDFAAGDTVVDPELANALVPVAERE